MVVAAPLLAAAVASGSAHFGVGDSFFDGFSAWSGYGMAAVRRRLQAHGALNGDVGGELGLSSALSSKAGITKESAQAAPAAGSCWSSENAPWLRQMQEVGPEKWLKALRKEVEALKLRKQGVESYPSDVEDDEHEWQSLD